LAIYSLAVNQALEVWHHSELFERNRSSISKWLDDNANATEAEPYRMLAGLCWWWHKVRMCPWCFSVPLGAAVVTYVELANRTGQYATWLMLPIYGLAVSRTANLLNDTLHAYLRTPRIYGTLLLDDTPVDNDEA
jgi:hypothetical protein